ncbi:DNA-binding IclR family transcriptional regulator [Prauserella sediminis]|uniref:DNA-binding IclR family transcriptional regulator n=1 Tax=Prauserella sediminis TaxID=577680 RepID=A0A839XP43_9PSEU|nr:IclR family transcriptional regulator [Prauserella sediminis]MBB3665612.1 DNA-binding IclR family transcriptional regulator [Prauserella sediminis]
MTITADGPPIESAVSPPQADTGERSMVGRLDALLAAFVDHDRSLSLSEISQRVGLPKSTVHRLTEQLCSVGWLERNSGGYRVGFKLLEVGGLVLQRNGLRETAYGHIYPLARKTGLAVQLAILDGAEVVYLDRVDLGGLDLPTRVGGRQPAYCTGLGKAMLAFEDEAAQATALADMPARTAATITDPRAMRAELETIRTCGYALDRGEGFHEIACVAAPIRSSGRAIGAISVTGPIRSMRAQPLVQEIRRTAKAVWEGRSGFGRGLPAR